MHTSNFTLIKARSPIVLKGALCLLNLGLFTWQTFAKKGRNMLRGFKFVNLQIKNLFLHRIGNEAASSDILTF